MKEEGLAPWRYLHDGVQVADGDVLVAFWAVGCGTRMSGALDALSLPKQCASSGCLVLAGGHDVLPSGRCRMGVGPRRARARAHGEVSDTSGSEHDDQAQAVPPADDRDASCTSGSRARPNAGDPSPEPSGQISEARRRDAGVVRPWPERDQSAWAEWPVKRPSRGCGRISCQ
jgi:hypothetical protein